MIALSRVLRFFVFPPRSQCCPLTLNLLSRFGLISIRFRFFIRLQHLRNATYLTPKRLLVTELNSVSNSNYTHCFVLYQPHFPMHGKILLISLLCIWTVNDCLYHVLFCSDGEFHFCHYWKVSCSSFSKKSVYSSTGWAVGKR